MSGALAPERASRLLLFAQRRILRDTERKFSSVQVDIRGDVEKMILEYGKSIPEDQLYYGEGGEGHETNVHVTIKYGLHEESVEPVKELLNEVGPIELFLGRTAMFESENYDVLYLQIESEDLRRLNAYIADSMEVTDTHPSYTPHCTIAYLKKGCAVHYLGDDRFDGIPLSLDTITFGSVNGKDTTFRVASAEPSPLWQDAEDGIARTFTFDDRRKLASFVSSVFKHANSVNHHPDVRTNGDSARVSYCTHSQNDEVTNLDLESAVVVDMLARTYGVKETSTRFARGENQLHTAADKRLDEMRSAVLKAFKQGAGKIKKNKLRAALMTKNRKTASQAVEGVQTAVQNSLWRSLPGILSETLQEGGKAGVQMLKQRLGIRAAAKSDDEFIDWEFDDTNENAVQWVEEHGAELAKGLSQTTQDEINDALKDAFEGGDLNEAIDLIVNAVGDPERADLIARTELMRASNEGQRQAWSQAVDEGVLTGDERKTWIATEIGACDECDALDGEVVDLDGEYPNDGGDGPPLHPRCRCTEGIVYSEPKALGGKGSGNFGHKGRPGEAGGSTSGEEAQQERLAAEQNHPLAKPDFVFGMPHALNGPAQRYVAAYGEEFKSQPLPEHIDEGVPKECYKNASLAVMMNPELTYAEGFVQTPETGKLAFLHGWAVDRSGNVVDPTLKNPEKASYFGVQYDRKAYLKYLYSAKIYGVLGSTKENALKAVNTGVKSLRGVK